MGLLKRFSDLFSKVFRKAFLRKIRRKMRSGLEQWLKAIYLPVHMSYDKLKEWLLDPANVTGPIATVLYDILIGTFIKATSSNRSFRELMGDFQAKINMYTKDKSVTRCLIIDGKGQSSSLKELVSAPDAEIIFNSPREMILTLLFIIDIYQDLVDDTISIKGNPNVIYRYLFLITYLNPLARKIKINPSN